VKLKKSALGALSVVALVGSSLAIGATAASGDPSANVTICHRTNSNTNPYVQITVDESAVDGGNGADHLGQHTGPLWDPTLKAQHIKWGDIIPPFDVNNDPRPDPTLIANWPAGQAIFENDCNPVEPPAPELVDLSVAKLVVGTVPQGVTEFTAQVTCDDGTSEQVSLPISGGAGTPSSIEVEQGSQCTVVETATGGADTVGYSIVGVDVDPGVFIDTDTTVTITNTFNAAPPVGPEVAPETVADPPAVAPAAVTASPAFTG
jgi:hypothetical protein